MRLVLAEHGIGGRDFVCWICMLATRLDELLVHFTIEHGTLDDFVPPLAALS